jgi:hypothetical protein
MTLNRPPKLVLAALFLVASVTGMAVAEINSKVNVLIKPSAPCGGKSPCWLLKKGAVVADTSPNGLAALAETARYYNSIQAPPTLTSFKIRNQFIFNDGTPNKSGITAYYFNNGDLQFGREMHCNEQGGRTACYVSNYGPRPYPPGTLDNGKLHPNREQALAELEAVASGTGDLFSIPTRSTPPRPFATVAMDSLPVAPPSTTVAVREADGETFTHAPKDCFGANYSGWIASSGEDVDTGLDIETGDTVIFSATGSIWAGDCKYGGNSPDGMSWTAGYDYPPYPLPGAHQDALIGRVGSSGPDGLPGRSWFEIGSYSSYQHEGEPGRLFLRTNDNKPGNGTGAFSVTIKIERNQQVRFYVFDEQENLIPTAALDREGPKSVPQMCMACHGGDYSPTTHAALGASFLPFDVFSFKYSEKPGLRLKDQQEKFRKLNLLVKNTNPNPNNMNQPIHHLIDDFYNNHVDVPNTEALPPKTPPSWGKHEALYRGFYAPYCRTCHSALAPGFDFYSDFTQFSDPKRDPTVAADVCNGKMPDAQVPYTALAGTKLDFVEAKDLIALGFPCLVDSAPVSVGPPVKP